MKKKRMEFFRRAIPLLLAAVLAAGTLLGTLGTVFAKADEGDSDSSDSSSGSSEDGAYASWQPLIQFPRFWSTKSRFENGDSEENGGLKPATSYFAVLDVVIRTDKEADSSTRATNVTPRVRLKPADSSTIELGKKGEDTEWVGGGSTSTYRKDSKDMIEYCYEFKDWVCATGGTNKQFKLALDVYHEDGKYIGHGPITATVSNKNDLGGYEPGSYDDDTGTSSSSSKAEVLTTPKMIITNFDIPDEVEFGEEFRVSIEFMNNSKVKSMENVSMTITPSEGVAILNGVNKRHYVNIPRRQSTSESFRFKAGDKLAAEAITITVKWDYQYKADGAYKDASSEEILSIKSIPKPEEKKEDEDKEGTEGSISAFEILSIVPPDDVFPGEPAYATVKVINKDHRYDASNVQLTITGEGLLNSGNTVYHGALAHSSQAEIETELQFDKPGAYKLLATVVYEDSVGKDEDGKPIVRINDQQKEFTVVVQEQKTMGGMDGMGMGGMEPTIGMSGFDENGMPVGGSPVDTAVGWIRAHIALSVGGGVALLVAIILVIRFIRKKKAEKDEDI